MTTTEIITSVSIVSAFTSATLVTYFNYRFGVKSKKLDILYTNRLIAFKEISSKILSFKNYCLGKIAFSEGNEFSPFYEEGFRVQYHRTEISKSLELNGILLSYDSRSLITDLLNQMSSLCNGEAALACNRSTDLNLHNEYDRMATLSESAVDVLYKELDIVI